MAQALLNQARQRQLSGVDLKDDTEAVAPATIEELDARPRVRTTVRAPATATTTAPAPAMTATPAPTMTSDDPFLDRQ